MLEISLYVISCFKITSDVDALIDLPKEMYSNINWVVKKEIKYLYPKCM